MSGSESQQARADTAVRHAVSAIQDDMGGQTDVTIAELQKLESHNRAAIARYSDMNQAAEGLVADQGFLKDNQDEIRRYIGQVDDVLNEVSRLELRVREMDDWTTELEIMVKRL